MAKKSKRSNRLFDAANETGIQQADDAKQQDPVISEQMLTEASTALVGPGSVIDDHNEASIPDAGFTENLADQFFASQSMERLTKENKERLEQYDMLEAANATYAQQVSDLTDKLEQYIAESDKQKEEIKGLQEQVDKYLLRISELTFENARIRAEQRVAPQQVPNATNPTVTCKQPSTHVPYPSMTNGYSSWN